MGMKLRTVIIASLSVYAVFFREGDNDGSTPLEPTTDIATTGIIGLIEYNTQRSKPGPWLVFERLILLRYQELKNQARNTAGEWVKPKAPKIPNGWAAMTNIGFMNALRDGR